MHLNTKPTDPEVLAFDASSKGRLMYIRTTVIMIKKENIQ
jgi:hypothetical protein